MFPTIWIEEAQKRVAPYIDHTPLTHHEELDLFIKWDNQQVTGSFKARGAINKILSLQPWEISRGIVAASAGNHGQGVALASKIVHARSIIFAAEHAVPTKLNAIRQLGAEVRLVPGGYAEAEQAGIAYAASTGAVWVSPYNDGQVIAGQATMAMEILADLPQPADYTWIVPAGGGGLISGIGVAIKSGIHPQDSVGAMRLVGVQSAASPFLHHIYHHGSQEGCEELPSLADGLAGSVEANSITIPLVHKYADDFILVSEEEIIEAIRFAWDHYHERIEGSAATSLAAVLSGKVPWRPVVIVISGGNIQPETHQKILSAKF
jgi:threonine dehydratase